MTGVQTCALPIWGAGAMVGDMPIFNLVAHRHAHEHGPQWTTSFKREERTAFSVFKHK